MRLRAAVSVGLSNIREVNEAVTTNAFPPVGWSRPSEGLAISRRLLAKPFEAVITNTSNTPVVPHQAVAIEKSVSADAAGRDTY